MSELRAPSEQAADELIAVLNAILKAHLDKHPQFAALRMTPKLERRAIVTAMVQDISSMILDWSAKYSLGFKGPANREGEDA